MNVVKIRNLFVTFLLIMMLVMILPLFLYMDDLSGMDKIQALGAILFLITGLSISFVYQIFSSSLPSNLVMMNPALNA